MKVLIIDDDRVLADIVAYTFRREGFDVLQAYDGLSAITNFRENKPDLLILDINLVELDGFSVCEVIRKESSVPIIMLTVRGEDDDVVHGFELGADDYVPKPFSPRQLVARAHAVLRRTGAAATPAPRQIGNLTLAPNRRQVQIGQGEPIQLSDMEGRLLDLLMLNAGQILTTEVIFDHVWGTRGEQDDLRQLVRRLRNKIEPTPSQPMYIKNIPGLGYGLVANEELK